MGDLGKDFKTDWGLDGREFGGLRTGFGRVGVREKKRGYLVVVWEDNEGMRNNTGILSPLSTWVFLITVIFLEGRELNFLFPIFSYTHTRTRKQMQMPLTVQYLPIFTTGTQYQIITLLIEFGRVRMSSLLVVTWTHFKAL